MLSPDSAGKAAWNPADRSPEAKGFILVDYLRISAKVLPPVAVVCASALLSGCLAGPTYGTGTGSNVQLLEDVTGVLSVGGDDQPQIAYTPRPELVEPPSTEVLPTPQEPATEANAAWPESPEQARARIRADATANQDIVGYRPEGLAMSDDASEPRARSQQQRQYDRAAFGQGGASTIGLTTQSQREEFNRRLALRQQGDPTQRRYLSEPPVEYRTPEEGAPVGDIGVDERDKAREARQAAGGGGGLRSLWPF